jgi:hypothetical protein
MFHIILENINQVTELHCNEQSAIKLYLFTQVSLCITITILDIIHPPVFYLKKKKGISKTEFSLRLQVERTQMGPIERVSLWTPSEDETESSLQNVVFK